MKLRMNMRLLFTTCIATILLFSCENKKKVLNEDFSAIGFVSRGYEMQLPKNLYMEIYQFHFILFTYHDTVFQVEIKNNQPVYSYLKVGQRAKDSLAAALKPYKTTSLKKQLKLITKIYDHPSCAPAGYFLFSRNLNFGIFHYAVYGDLYRHFLCGKEVRLKESQFPKIYQTIYHTLNSKHWDYFMSDDYRYKEVRTYQRSHISFIEPSNN